MKKTIFILIIIALSLATKAQGIYNSGARIVSQSGSYWVVDNGSFTLTSESATYPATLANLIISDDASLTVKPFSYLTVSGSLSNSAGTGGLVVNPGGSLIETATGVSATVETAVPALQWHFISAPVSDAYSAMFLGKYLQKHTESTNLFTDILNSGTPLTPEKGFALWGDDAGFITTYTGTLNAGTESYSTSFSGPGKGWNLVGNPYPSAIDWDAATGWTKTNVNAATYVHVNASTWASYIAGVQANGGTRYIAPGQGFFVLASGAGLLGITDDVRVHQATTFFKNSDEVVPDLVRLQVSGNSYSDEAVVRFLPSATAEFDGSYDACKIFGDVAEAAQVYTTGSTQLAINSLPETDVVPVGVKAGVSGTYTIAATEINNLHWVTLEDTKTGIFTELATGGYTFYFETGENEMRFKLHFSALGIADNQPEAANIYSYQKTLFVNMMDQVKGDIFIYNIAGQLVASVPSASGMNEIQLPVTGNYIVKVVTGSSSEVKKIFIQ